MIACELVEQFEDGVMTLVVASTLEGHRAVVQGVQRVWRFEQRGQLEEGSFFQRCRFALCRRVS